MKRIWFAWVFALTLVGFSSTSSAADNLACIEQGYSAGESASFERFYESLRVENLNSDMPPDILAAVTRQAGECADAHDWPPEAIEDAVLYRLATILRTALERRSPLTPAQMRRITEAVASADQERLGRIFGAIEEAAMNGEDEPQPSDSDSVFIGRILLRSGVPMTESNAQYAGAVIGARMMGERAQQRFAAR